MKRQQKLPNTLSGLIEVAIQDARGLDRKRYLPDGGSWHEPVDLECQICLAGVVMAGSLRANPAESKTPGLFTRPLARKLRALEQVRQGNWLDAWCGFYEVSLIRVESILEGQLNSLPIPEESEFDGWRALDSHLASLQAILPKLREIEGMEAKLAPSLV